MTLNQLSGSNIPCLVEILALRGSEDLTERLREMGFFEGAHLDVLGRLPFGGPWLVRLGSTAFALRDLEAGCAEIRRLS
jgi:Fe2+ transport system protein FeoA